MNLLQRHLQKVFEGLVLFNLGDEDHREDRLQISSSLDNNFAMNRLHQKSIFKSVSDRSIINAVILSFIQILLSRRYNTVDVQ